MEERVQEPIRVRLHQLSLKPIFGKAGKGGKRHLVFDLELAKLDYTNLVIVKKCRVDLGHVRLPYWTNRAGVPDSIVELGAPVMAAVLTLIQQDPIYQEAVAKGVIAPLVPLEEQRALGYSTEDRQEVKEINECKKTSTRGDS